MSALGNARELFTRRLHLLLINIGLIMINRIMSETIILEFVKLANQHMKLTVVP